MRPAYPPIAPAVDWGDSYATDRFVTSAVDATLIPSDTSLYYRVMAYDEAHRAMAASPVRSTHLREVVELGPSRSARASGRRAPASTGRCSAGSARCFSAYHVLVGPVGARQASTLTTLSDQSTTELQTIGPPSRRSRTRSASRRCAPRRSGASSSAETEAVAYTVP